MAAELGHLPLALAHAAPVIAGQRLDTGHTWTGCRHAPAEHVPDRGRDSRTRLACAGGSAVLAGVRAADRTGVCTRVMEIMAVLSSAGSAATCCTWPAGWACWPAAGGAAPALVDRALEWLSDRSLLTFSLDGQTVIMHRAGGAGGPRRAGPAELLTSACWAAASSGSSRDALVGSQDRPAVRDIPQQARALLAAAEPSGEIDEELARVPAATPVHRAISPDRAGRQRGTGHRGRRAADRGP